MPLIEGSTLFKTHLTATEFYNGTDTGKYSVTIELTDETKKSLEDLGVITKEYDGTPLRRFQSRYPIDVYNDNGLVKPEKVQELPQGSKIRIDYITRPNPNNGEIPYAKRIMILELGKESIEDDGFFKESDPF